MVRTKKHFRPPSSSSSSASSSEEEDDDDVLVDQQMMAQRGRGKQMIFGRGKQLPPSVAVAAPPPPRPIFEGRGKQLRAPEPEPESDDDDDDDSSDETSSDDGSSDDDEESAPVPPPPAARGKQLARPTAAVVGRGKQLRAPSSSSPPPTVAASIGSPSGVAPLATSMMSTGKQFGRSIGKQLAMQTVQPAMDDDDDDDSSESSSEEEPWNAAPLAAVQQRGMGKQLRLPPPSDTADKEESDMEESSEEEEDEDSDDEKKVKSPPPSVVAKKKTAPPNKKSAKRSKPEEESEDSEFEPEAKKKNAPPPKRGKGRPPARAAATRAARSTQAAAKKEISSEDGEEESEEEDDDDDEEEEEEEEESEDEISDDSSDEEQEWDMETFDTQKLVQGAEDKKYLESLPELERENILAERFEKLKSEADMKKAIRENKRKEREKKKPAGAKKRKPAAKRSAPAKGGKKAPPAKKTRSVGKKMESDDDEDADKDDNEEAPDTSADGLLAQSLAGKRVSARNLDKKGKQFKKQVALARIRESRASKQTLADEESESDLDYGRDSDDSDDDYEESSMLKPWQQQKGRKKHQPESSDDESMGADDDNQQTPKGSMETRTEDTEAVLEDYYKVTVPRRRLMRWCNEPFFEKAVKNFYVRLGIGRDNMTQKPCYRLCQITGVVIKSEYSFPSDPNQKAISTNKWLKVSFGKTLREFKMFTASDHRPSSDDVNKLVTQLKAERLTDSILTKKTANKLRKCQDELVTNYTYTKEDVDMLVSEKKKRNNKACNIGLEKTRIAIAVQAANDEVEDAKKRLEDAEVERMEADDDDEIAAAAERNVERAKEELERATKKLADRKEEQQRIHKEEEDRTRRLNKSSKVQNWVKVNQRAKLANRNADFESYKDQLAREKIQGSAEPKFDPYARRSMKPKNLWEVGGPKTNDSFGSSGIAEEEKKEATERDDTNVGKDCDRIKREDIPEPPKIEYPGQANQFAFDDDIIIGSDITNMGGIGAKKVRVRARKGLSLSEYQERKASGIL